MPREYPGTGRCTNPQLRVFVTPPTPTIQHSYNVKSVTKVAMGEIKAFYEVPFKADENPVVATAQSGYTRIIETKKTYMRVQTREYDNSQIEATPLVMMAFGELENE